MSLALPTVVAVEIRFYVDPGTGVSHVRRHGITEGEVLATLERSFEDRPGADGSRSAIGRTESGRYLRVIYVPDAEGPGIFVVTAYELTGKPLAAFRRRQRRRR